MFDLVLHTGLEHPNLLWIAAVALLSFLLGLGAGRHGDRLRAWLRTRRTASRSPDSPRR